MNIEISKLYDLAALIEDQIDTYIKMRDEAPKDSLEKTKLRTIVKNLEKSLSGVVDNITLLGLTYP
jgi:hypothetical protein